MNEQRIPSVSSLERMIPETIQTDEVAGMQALRLHVERYEFALRHVKGLVGDIACGSGFGSKILVQKGEQVLGVDLDQDVINYATRSYNDSNIHYICADAMQLTHEPFDVIVSFETVEHVPRPKALLHHLASLLKPGGTLIASVPITPSMDANPYHLHDFNERSFMRLFPPNLRLVDQLHQTQPYNPIAVTKKSEKHLQDLRSNLLRYYVQHPTKALRRLGSTLRYGFTNRYLSAVMVK